MSEHEDHDEQERVRRLLAAAGGGPEAGGPDAGGPETVGPEARGPRVPDHVAARLDDVLAGLVADRAAGSSPPDPDAADPDASEPDAGRGSADAQQAAPTVTDLAARRRRRWPQLLAAAAAVSVLGIGLGNILGDTGALDGQGAAESAAGGAADTATQDGVEVQGAKPQEAPRSRVNGLDAPVRGAAEHAPRLRSGSLTLDVQRIEDFALAVPVASTPRRWARACVQPSAGPGDEWLAVRLDGRSGVLLLRAPHGGRRTAQVYTCDHPDVPAAETTVDVR